MREFFRIVRGKEAMLEDFLSLRALGRRLTNPALEREWSEGVSVYDDLDRACQISRRFGFRLGTYVIKVVIPEGSTVKFKQTSEDKHHYTIYAAPEAVLALVEGPAVRIPGAPGD